jgi:hypothetical protein
MDQSEAKQRFVYYLRKVLDGDDEVVDPSAELHRLGELLWGCHDIIEAPASALDAIGCDPGTTYHDAVLHRALANVLDLQGLEGQEALESLYPIFLKDQQGRGRSGDRAAFRQWLRDNVADGEELAQADEATTA